VITYGKGRMNGGDEIEGTGLIGFICIKDIE
jgi:hypothetical protein